MSTDETLVAQPPPPPEPAKRSVGDILRRVSFTFGELLITAGLVVLLFVVYEVWITNIFAHEKQAKVHSALEKEWKDGVNPLPLPGQHATSIPLGSGLANLYLPRLGSNYHFTIVEGSTVPTQGQLEKGPVHYGKTALPGQVGNFAMAGHRVGHGEPFLNIDKLKSGDPIIIETENTWYVYTVLGTPAGEDPQRATPSRFPNTPAAIPGREVTDPNGIAKNGQSVLNPVPDNPTSVQPTKAMITLTACTPKFSATQRMIVHGVLTRTIGKAKAPGGGYDNAMPGQLSAAYGGSR